VAVVGKLVEKYEISNNSNGEKQYTKQHKNTEHANYKAKHTKQGNNPKTNKLKNIK
jgi:hypothetical protein